MKQKTHKLLPFILPGLILYSLFVIYPLFSSLFLSLFSWPGVGPKQFVGLSNFKEIFFGYYSKELFNAFFNNIYFFVLTTVLELGLGFIIALMLATKIRGYKFFRTFVYIPNMIPLVLVGYLWVLFLNPQIGLINNLLKLIGLDNLARPWLGEPNLALTVIIFTNVWRNIGFYILVLLAAILDIEPSLIEAAYIDGASNTKIVKNIIFPLTFSTFRTLIILLFIWTFNIFDIIYAMEGAQAGPFRSTDVLGTLFYRTAFGGLGSAALDMGLGAAITVFIFIIVMPISILYVYLSEKNKRRDL